MKLLIESGALWPFCASKLEISDFLVLFALNPLKCSMGEYLCIYFNHFAPLKQLLEGLSRVLGMRCRQKKYHKINLERLPETLGYKMWRETLLNFHTDFLPFPTTSHQMGSPSWRKFLTCHIVNPRIVPMVSHQSCWISPRKAAGRGAVRERNVLSAAAGV